MRNGTSILDRKSHALTVMRFRDTELDVLPTIGGLIELDHGGYAKKADSPVFSSSEGGVGTAVRADVSGKLSDIMMMKS